MFRAKMKNSGRWISAIDNEQSYLRKLCSEKQIICPDCNHQMNLRVGTKTPHFYHLKGAICTDIYAELETDEHLNGKQAIYKFFNRKIS